MPELPDVELYKRHLDATCLGRTIRHVAVADARILADLPAGELARRLEGARIGASRRHGKHLLVDLGPPGWLTLHFGMTGALKHFTDSEQDPPYDRVRFDFADGHHLAYTDVRLFGRVGLASDADAFIAAEGLGPDALDPRFDFAAFERALAGRKRDVKSALMDQEAVAGIGNIYSDEILFQAGINPRTRCDRLDADARPRLFSRIREGLETPSQAAPAQNGSSTVSPVRSSFRTARRADDARAAALKSPPQNSLAAPPTIARDASPRPREPRAFTRQPSLDNPLLARQPQRRRGGGLLRVLPSRDWTRSGRRGSCYGSRQHRQTRPKVRPGDRAGRI